MFLMRGIPLQSHMWARHLMSEVTLCGTHPYPTSPQGRSRAFYWSPPLYRGILAHEKTPSPQEPHRPLQGYLAHKKYPPP